jgi:alkanesulfonate monooxygenase SsuD/methylene tetrahydromethanopterin reductase-like flavin-dependent oxidoreductase (luciferase family)
MPVEFVGFITNNNSSETIVRSGPALDPPYIETVAKAHELAGFDRALLAFHSTSPDCLQVAQHVLGITRKLKMMIAQRPGFTAPTLLARQLATIDQLYPGRVSLHVITGGNAAELRQDGNTLDDKDERYARTKEFLDVVRLEWTSEKPFDYSGKYYKVEKGFSQVKPSQQGGIYTFVGGGSDAAIEVAGKHADTFALWGESYAQVRDVTARVRAAAARHGRPCPRFSLSVRPILAGTEEAAWKKAENILDTDRQAAMDRNRQAHRRQQQHHGAGRNSRTGRRRVRRLLRSRRQPLFDPWLRPADRCDRLWPHAHSLDAHADRRTRRKARRRRGVTLAIEWRLSRGPARHRVRRDVGRRRGDLHQDGLPG